MLMSNETEAVKILKKGATHVVIFVTFHHNGVDLGWSDGLRRTDKNTGW